jgi:predicted amidophosphoribosyltransferase
MNCYDEALQKTLEAEKLGICEDCGEKTDSSPCGNCLAAAAEVEQEDANV